MKEFNEKIQAKFAEICKTGKLFRSKLTGNDVWDIYLSSFTEEDDPVFRDPESSTHNCNHCKNFIRRYGNIVGIDNEYNITTMFDIQIEGEYQNSVHNLSKKIKEASVVSVFFETFNELNSLPYEKCTKSNTVFRLGIDRNHKRYTKEEAEKYGVVKPDQIVTFNHIHLDLPRLFVDMSNKSVEALVGSYKDSKNVFQRTMEEIPLDTLELVRDLINQGSLLDGTTHIQKIEKMIPLKKEFDKLPVSAKDNWCWVTSFNFPLARFKNELIGVLCTELAEGMELNKACQNWNKRVDPANYMKATAPITKKQIEEARKFVEENGYTESFDRRLATIEDIKASEILHINTGDGKIKSVSVFDNVKSTSTRHKRSEFDGIQEVDIDKFMKEILPTCSSIEAYFLAKHQGNLVTLTTSKNPNSKRIFKWGNNYSWNFNGNLAGKSQLTEMVEAKGGRTDGVFRFTHSWNEIEENRSLMDLHVFMPGCELPKKSDFSGPNVKGRRVGWNLRTDAASGGVQDVDYVNEAPKGYVPVENITFPSISKMPEGKYTCMINNWNFRYSGGRGKAEIAINGDLYQYVYPPTKNNDWITVAEVTLKNGHFTIEHKLEPVDEFSVSKEIYGLETNQFQKVNLVCLSPNHWDDNKVGNKHYFFMLEGCKNPNNVRGFHNENLIPDLLEHRKVMEVLGANSTIDPSEKQISGLGFNATVRDELILKLSGTHKRMVKVKF